MSTKIEIETPEIPSGHGASFRRGIADGLMESKQNKADCHHTHNLTYEKGFKTGSELKQKIAPLVKKS